jgi:hypothetical protein
LRSGLTCSNAAFGGSADFSRISQTEDAAEDLGPLDARFAGARFDDSLSLSGASVGGHLTGDGIVVGGRLDVSYATVGYASFDAADVRDTAWLHAARFDRLSAERARFRMPGAMGDVIAKDGIHLDHIVVEAPLDLRVDAPFISVEGASLLRGGRLAVRASRVTTESPSLVLKALSCEDPFVIMSVPRLDSDADARGTEVELDRSIELRARYSGPDQAAGADARDDAAPARDGHAELLERISDKLAAVRAAPEAPAEVARRAEDINNEATALRARLEQPNSDPALAPEERHRAQEALRVRADAHGAAAIRAFVEGLGDEVRAIAQQAGDDVQLQPRTPDDTAVQVLGLEDVDLALVTFAGVDMTRCRFAGGRNLDKARLDGVFPRSPDTLRWSKRLVIAEERWWRVRAGHGDAWRRPECGPPDEAEPFYTHGNAPPEPPQLAEIYRGLRKAREDAKDEPGAADFYYGEMEMRRHSRGRAPGRIGDFGERTVLWLYWLTSGYGLRASRAVAALLLTIAVFTGLFLAFGLKQESFSAALLQSIQGAAFRSGDADALTEVGQYLQVPLRLLGPLFFGLGLLSLRGRVKR